MARMRWISAVGSLLLLLALASGSWAQTDTTRNESGAVTGRVVSVDTAGKMLTIEEYAGGRWTFAVNAHTTYKNQDAPIALTDLKKDWQVVVNYDSAESGNVALLVEVVDTP